MILLVKHLTNLQALDPIIAHIFVTLCGKMKRHVSVIVDGSQLMFIAVLPHLQQQLYLLWHAVICCHVQRSPAKLLAVFHQHL